MAETNDAGEPNEVAELESEDSKSGDGEFDGDEFEGDDFEEEAAEREPDIGPEDRFFVNGKPLPFDEFVAAVMAPLAPREQEEPQPQPEPQSWEVIWASRRPRTPDQPTP